MTTSHRGWSDPGMRRTAALSLLALAALLLSAGLALAHNVTPGGAGYIQEIWGVNLIPFMYLGAKHMVTGYDHILFLAAYGHLWNTLWVILGAEAGALIAVLTISERLVTWKQVFVTPA
ncbi:hypothetical protein SAMN04488047_11444 [Tranquillimonas alkanivorans]|uniref:HupE / UreJ protein n=1 Tax=Tranquillimonas alkanivorans TaxID=441119 RepID=A0A1I5TND9_9RHOB|nr:hypothetical protein SAMN04488047_11444 [Tranquillimonas alkanivorans]